MSIIDRVDAFQRRHPVVGFPLAVVYKFFDDQGPYLAAIISYYAFIAIFPLLLIATSVLGFVLQDNPRLQEDLLDTVLSQFPLVGDQLGRPDGLTGSTSAIVIGALAALYGAIGLGQALQNSANVAWAVPRNSRPNPILMRVRSILLLAIGALGLVAVSVAISVAGESRFVDLGGPGNMLTRPVGLLVTWLLFMSVFKLLSLGRASWKSVLPGAAVAAVGWQLLQVVGNEYVTGVVATASSMNQTFAVVLGLVAFLFLAGTIIILGIEVNVVRRRGMYPRALLTPFTDNVVLGPGDVRAYQSYARMQRHKGFQKIHVQFDEDRLLNPDRED